MNISKKIILSFSIAISLFVTKATAVEVPRAEDYRCLSRDENIEIGPMVATRFDIGYTGRVLQCKKDGTPYRLVDYVNGSGVLLVIYRENSQPEFYAEYKNGKKHGIYNHYDDEGRLYASYNYVEGKKHGKLYSYYKSGKVSSEANYENNLEVGTTKFYYESGSLSGIKVSNNESIVVKEEKYYENGAMQELGIYEDEGEIYKRTLFDEAGNITEKMMMNHGTGDALTTEYNIDGSKRYEVVFEDYMPKMVTTFDNGTATKFTGDDVWQFMQDEDITW